MRPIVLLLTIALSLLFSLVQPAAAAGFRLGVINEREDRPDFALAQYGPLHEWLAAQVTGHGPVELVIARSIDEMAGLLADGRVDGLFEGVMPTLALRQRGIDLEPALLVWRKGQREYHSVFFVRRDSGIHDLADLAGKTIAFEAPRSTSAFFVPRAELRAAGMVLVAAEAVDAATDPAAVRYIFAGSEINQAYWVERGRADAGAFNDGDWQRVTDTVRDQLEIIHRTRPLLRWLFSFHADLAPDLREAVSAALQRAHLDKQGAAALEAASRIKKLERLNQQDQENLAYWAEVLAEVP